MTPVGSATSRGSDFAALSRTVQEAGLLRRRHDHYAWRIGLTVAAFAAGWAVFALVGDSWWQLLTAAFLAAASTQLAYTGHDAGHKQIFRTRRGNDVVGYVHAALTGLSYGWWVGKHNRHHANPNHESDDPDLDIPILAFFSGQAAGRRGVTRWTTKYQAFLFFPVLLLEGLSLHWSALDAVVRGGVRNRGVEAVVLVGHTVAYVGAVLLVLSPGKALVFVAVHQGLWGLWMGCAFAPNHKGMPTWADGADLDFLRKQVLTSRDVRGGALVDLALGGLNYQVVHHLFPNMPRPHLRLAQPIVERFCADRGIPYVRCGLLDSYGQVLRHLHAVGAPLRAARA
ncbi:acyl-CoA desaturase [Pseudonocardia sp.]|uniref:fatty acid desaturase family protein n=1 Tax=Pseudonocardia sp. TaxID=60912 RepID=UPI002634A8CA|nr:acyl-CoA desaturase [Pseudonocardia sp.]